MVPFTWQVDVIFCTDVTQTVSDYVIELVMMVTLPYKQSRAIDQTHGICAPIKCQLLVIQEVRFSS